MNELDLFTEALSRTDPAERAAFLDEACAGNPELRRRLEELLAGHARSRGPLDRPIVAPADFGPTADLSPRDATGQHRPLEGAETLARADPNATTDVESGARTPPTDEFGESRPDPAAVTIDRSDSGATTAPPSAPTPPAARVATHEGIGTVIAGRYTLVDVIGEGGMGSVYLASQTEPVKRQVALKLIRTGMDSRGVLARFDAERQALALMDHPNIARIYDGGVTPAGQPFFVMELVHGVPLTEYCDRKRLTVKDRLELFVSVCQAVQHAHQKGIIHRDLKPGNVMVTEVDGRPTPKVIDFGVAKATEQNLTDMSFADTGAIVGTPTYMSPEQADPSSMDIDTRTDVYALGVMLYELLVGSPPLDARQFRRGAILEMLRMVREVDPPRPSTKLNTAEALPSIAANRSIEPARLSKMLRGELDCVVMKALEKDRDRRYDTANGLARDIQRYLADEVVEARPPSRGYRLKKLVKRNKGQVIAASLVFLTLVGGIVGTTIGLYKANRARDAEAEQRKVAVGEQKRAAAGEKLAGERLVQVEAARKKAEEEKQVAQSVKGFLQEKLLAQADTRAQADALLKMGGTAAEAKLNPTIRELLDRASRELSPARIEQSFPGQPLVQAEILATVGTTYYRIGDYQTAIDTLKRADALFRQYLGPDDPATLANMNALGYAYGRTRGNEALTLSLFENLLELSKARLGPEHPDTLRRMHDLAGAYLNTGKQDLGKSLLQTTLELQKAKIGPEHPHTLRTMESVADVHLSSGRLDLALPLLEEVLRATRARLGPEHPQTLVAINNLALAYRMAGRPGDAVPLFDEAVKLFKAKLGLEDRDTLICMHNLAMSYREVGKLDRAIPLMEETLKLMKAKLGTSNGTTITSMMELVVEYEAAGKADRASALMEEMVKAMKPELGRENNEGLVVLQYLTWTYQRSGKLEKAVPLLEQTLALVKDNFPPDHPGTLMAMGNLAECYQKLGKPDRAVPLLERTLALQKAKLGADNPQTLVTMNNLAVGYRDSGKLDVALPLFEQTLALQKAKLGPDHADTLTTMGSLGYCYLATRRLDLAVPLLEQTLALQKARKHDEIIKTMSNLGSAYVTVGNLDLAQPLLAEALALQKARFGPDHPDVVVMMGNLAESYMKAGKLDLALPVYEQRLPLIRAKLGLDHQETLSTMQNLATCYMSAGKLDLALPLYEQALPLVRAKFGPGHPNTLTTLNNLAQCYQKLGKHDLLRSTLREGISSSRRVYPGDSLPLAQGLAVAGLLLLQSRDFDEAEPLLRECLAIREKSQPDHWATFNTQSMLGGALLGQKKVDEAESLLRKGYEGMKQREQTIPPQGQVRLSDALDRLIELYTATKRPEEVKKYQAERTKYPIAAPIPGEKK